jgi:hypothetical protein
MALSAFMLYTLYVIMGLIALDILAGLYKSITTNSFSFARLAGFLTSGILYLVFPLTLLISWMPKDPTGWVLKIMYYIAALGIVIKYILDIVGKLSR